MWLTGTTRGDIIVVMTVCRWTSRSVTISAIRNTTPVEVRACSRRRWSSTGARHLPTTSTQTCTLTVVPRSVASVWKTRPSPPGAAVLCVTSRRPPKRCTSRNLKRCYNHSKSKKRSGPKTNIRTNVRPVACSGDRNRVRSGYVGAVFNTNVPST